MPKAKFHKTLYVVMEEEGNSDKQFFPIADDELDTHAKVGETVKVGVYNLEKVISVTTNLDIKVN
jgi:hypothetical protein